MQSAVWQELAGGLSSAHDLCVAAPTGSGKTLAYALPVINALARWAPCTAWRVARGEVLGPALGVLWMGRQGAVLGCALACRGWGPWPLARRACQGGVPGRASARLQPTW